MEIRLQKYLAENGVASRRKCEQLIILGKVEVNGKTITELGTKVDPEKDIVKYNGKEIEKQNKDHVYILLNKPIGFVTTVDDQFNRDTVMDLLRKGDTPLAKKNSYAERNVPGRVVPVGRLDMYTSGALILTDDGDFVYKVTHPKHEIEKTYTVTLKGIVTDEDIEKLKSGIEIDNDYITSPAKARIMKTDKEKDISRVEIKIHEGKNKQVRKMCEAINKKVLALHRAKIGDIGVKDLSLGSYRYLTKNEIKKLIEN